MGETAQEVKQGRGLFSTAERQAVVRSFIEQYLAGRVHIRYWEPGFNVVDVGTGKQTPGDQKVRTKKAFLDAVESVCNPSANTTNEIHQRAVDSVFNLLVTLRSGGFIEGDFPVGAITESRLATLESRITSVEELLEDLKHIWKVKGA
jgi:hypothetical protein